MGWMDYLWDGQTRGKGSRSISAPIVDVDAKEVPLKGHIWLMDPATHIATRMAVFPIGDKSRDGVGYKMVPTNDTALIPASHTHKDAAGNFVLDAMPAGGTLINGTPVFKRRKGHAVAAIDAGHGVNWSGYGDPGSLSGGHAGAGPIVSEATITTHLSRDAAVAFALRGWDVIVTRDNLNEKDAPRVHDGGFQSRMDAANQADAYIVLHADQRAVAPGKTEKQVGGVRLYVDKRIGTDDFSLQFAEYLNARNTPNEVIWDGYIRRPEYKFFNGEKVRGPLSIMLEPGAINLRADEMNMRSADWRGDFARELAQETDYFFHKRLPELRKSKADEPAPQQHRHAVQETDEVHAPAHTPPKPKTKAANIHSK